MAPAPTGDTDAGSTPAAATTATVCCCCWLRQPMLAARLRSSETEEFLFLPAAPLLC